MKFFTLVCFLTVSLTQVQTRVSNKFVMQQAIEGLTDCERAIWRSAFQQTLKLFNLFNIVFCVQRLDTSASRNSIPSRNFQLTIALLSHFKLKSYLCAR